MLIGHEVHHSFLWCKFGTIVFRRMRDTRSSSSSSSSSYHHRLRWSPERINQWDNKFVWSDQPQGVCVCVTYVSVSQVCVLMWLKCQRDSMLIATRWTMHKWSLPCVIVHCLHSLPPHSNHSIHFPFELCWWRSSSSSSSSSPSSS